MTAKHTERAFEDAIEHHLVSVGGWRKVEPQDFDRDLNEAEIIHVMPQNQAATAPRRRRGQADAEVARP